MMYSSTTRAMNIEYSNMGVARILGGVVLAPSREELWKLDISIIQWKLDISVNNTMYY